MMMSASGNIRSGYLAALRAVLTLQTVTVFAASVSAGLLLSVHGGKAFHSATSYTLFVIVLVHAATALLAWRPGRGSALPLLYATVFLAGTLAQVALGLAGLKLLHVPLGMLLFGASTLELAWVWMIRPTAARTVLTPVQDAAARAAG